MDVIFQYKQSQISEKSGLRGWAYGGLLLEEGNMGRAFVVGFML